MLQANSGTAFTMVWVSGGESGRLLELPDGALEGAMTEILRLSLVEAYGIAYDALARNGFAHDHADAIARSVAASERDGCHSHGLYRVLVCVRTARSGMVELAARPHIEDISPALLRADARYAFSQVTFDMAAERLVEKANHTGVAALAINHCYHFSALWQEVERLATMGVAALAMNPTTACVAPSGRHASFARH